MAYQQYDLQSGHIRTVGWLEWKHPLKRGTMLTLKHSGDQVWTVTSVHREVRDTPPDRTWKVGGLV